MAGQKLSLEEATSARLPFDVAKHIDIEEEKEAKRKVEEYKQARAEHLKTVGKMAFAQQCIDDKIMPLKKQKRIIGKYTYGQKGALFANINSVPDALYIIALLLILVFILSVIVTIGCSAAINEDAFLEWAGTTTKEFRAFFIQFIFPIPPISLGLFLLIGFSIRSIPGRRAFIAETKEKIAKKATEERVLPDHIVDVPCKLKRFFAEMLLEYNMVAVEYVSENGAIRLWDESGNHKLFKKDFCGEAYQKEIEYLGTEVEPNKFYNIADLITEKAEK
mgnify:CR=1 FL=1|jgi:hypothetical protein